MYESLFRDETLVPSVAKRLADLHSYLDSARDVLLGGRGRTRQRTRAAIGHALAFATWRSLTQEQRLGQEEAVTLMCRLVETASRR
jgi:hypothetical protein